jgi:hypothetical protein
MSVHGNAVKSAENGMMTSSCSRRLSGKLDRNQISHRSGDALTAAFKATLCGTATRQRRRRCSYECRMAALSLAGDC